MIIHKDSNMKNHHGKWSFSSIQALAEAKSVLPVYYNHNILYYQ